MYATIGGNTCDTDFTCVRLNGQSDKVEWYNISGVPSIFIDGKLTNSYLADVKTTQAETTPVTISLKGSSFDDLTVNIKVTVSSDTDLSAEPLYLFVMATIDSVHYAGYNGETEHEQVFLGFIGDTGPGGLGKALTLNKDQAVEWTETWTMKSDYPNEAHGRDLGTITDWNTTVWDKKNMNLVAFVQHKTTLEVVQVEMISRRNYVSSLPPVLSAITDVSIEEDSTTIVIASATDPEGDPLTYSATADTSAIEFQVSNDTVTVKPLLNWNGSSVVTVAVTDGFTSAAEQSFTLTVTAAPDPPGAFAWTSPSSENDSIEVTSSNGGDYFSIGWENSVDPDGDAVTYKLAISHPPFSLPTVFTEPFSGTLRSFSFAEFIGLWPSSLQMINRLNYKFDVYAYSGNDSTVITGTRQLLVKRSGDLNTESIGIPNSFVLHPNYPNPFNPETHIRFEIPYAGNVDLSIYNLRGMKVKTLYSGQKSAGVYSFKWNGKNDNNQSVSGGVYIYKLQSGKQMQMHKMILLK
ncbi:MAG TPA: T9SS type A sorting domain-containing protein [Methylococcales bacterium]|nr:T9SS type A sorting domain-containing protein [Methylococcales bacterium]